MKQYFSNVNFNKRTSSRQQPFTVVTLAIALILSGCEKEYTKEKDSILGTSPTGEVINVLGQGPIKIFKGDVYGVWNEETEAYDLEEEAHGDRTTQTLQKYIDKDIYTLYEVEGGLTSFIDSTLHKQLQPSNPTSIISSSSDAGELGAIPIKYKNILEKFNRYNVLLISSLENVGVDGSIIDGVPIASQHPHGPTNTAIATFPEGQPILKKTIFVGAINRWGEGRIDLKDFGLFQANTIFVKLDRTQGDVSESTSHATPKLAALAANILFKNQSLSPEDLKTELLNRSETQTITIYDIKENSSGEYEDDIQKKSVYVLNF